MNPSESWLAEQARLLTLEDGFGPGYAKPAGSSSAIKTEEAEDGSLRSSTA